MAKEFSRARRVGEQIRRELTQIIRTELADDPRMAMVSITAADVSRDLAYAKIYITLVGDAEQRTSVVERLNHAAPMLRSMLGRLLRLRSVPNLAFYYDESVERGVHLSRLIDDAVATDTARRRDSEEPESTGSDPSSESSC